MLRFYEILGKWAISVMVVWLFDLSFLLIKQGCSCNSPSTFCVLTVVYVLPDLLWSVHYLKWSISLAWLLDCHLDFVWCWLILMFVLTDGGLDLHILLINCYLYLLHKAMFHYNIPVSLHHLLLLKILHTCRSYHIFQYLLENCLKRLCRYYFFQVSNE